jgi:type IV fimbrial biogenesis protein FimT
MSRAARHQGFTLIELLVSVSIAAILLAVAVPSFRDATHNGQMRALSNGFVGGTLFARAEAIKRGSTVTMCASSTGTACVAGDWHDGWIVVDASSGEVLQRHEAASPGYRMLPTGYASQILFTRTGFGGSTGTMKVCREDPSPGPSERLITLDATGRTRVTSTTTGSCE